MIFGVMCVLSWTYSYAFRMWVTVQYVLLLSDCLTAVCFMSFALCCVIINCFAFFLIYPFHVCFLVLYVFLSILCALCFVYCFSPSIYLLIFLFVCNFTDHCHRVETQLHLINISYIHPYAYKYTRKRAITCTIVLRDSNI